MWLDLSYLFGLLVVWYGNFEQIRKLMRTHSTKGLSLKWIACIDISIAIRSVRAITSDEWVWRWTYIVSLIIGTILLLVVLHYKRKYPNK